MCTNQIPLYHTGHTGSQDMQLCNVILIIGGRAYVTLRFAVNIPEDKRHAADCPPSVIWSLIFFNGIRSNNVWYDVASIHISIGGCSSHFFKSLSAICSIRL